MRALIAREDHGVRDALTANENIGSSPYRYELLLRYGLPRKHVLRLAFEPGDLVPRFLIHPRYWLAGSDTIETMPDSPERPGIPPQRKRTHTLVSRTPTRPDVL